MIDIAQEFPAIVARLTGGEFRTAGGGLTFRCPCGDRHKNGDQHPSCRLYVGKLGNLMGRCLGCGAGWRELSQAAGIDPKEWYHHTQQHNRRVTQLKSVARYLYRCEDGSVYGIKTRYEPKTFGWTRPLPQDLRQLCGIPNRVSATVEGSKAMDAGWIKGKPDKTGTWHFRHVADAQEGAILIPAAGPCPLFRFPELLACKPDSSGVVICEGEKDTMAMVSLGFVATCAPHGANSWPAEYSQHFQGRSVLLCPDNDAPGRAFMERVAGSLLLAGVRELRVLDPKAPGYELAPGQDVGDWIRKQRAESPPVSRTIRAIVASLPKFERREAA